MQGFEKIEVEEDGVNVWSELYRMGKSHTFATPTLCNASIITGTIFWMVAHCKAFLLTAAKNPLLCLKEAQAEEIKKEDNL